MQPTGTVGKTLIGDHPGIISVKFGQIPLSLLGAYLKNSKQFNKNMHFLYNIPECNSHIFNR